MKKDIDKLLEEYLKGNFNCFLMIYEYYSSVLKSKLSFLKDKKSQEEFFLLWVLFIERSSSFKNKDLSLVFSSLLKRVQGMRPEIKFNKLLDEKQLKEKILRKAKISYGFKIINTLQKKFLIFNFCILLIFLIIILKAKF